MFKTKCKACGVKISKNYKFCPKCGTYVEGSIEKSLNDKKNYGMLGRNDEEAEIPKNDNIRLPMGLNSILNKLMKQMEKSFQELDKNRNKESTPNEKPKKKISSGISISITSGADGEPRIKIKKFGENNENKNREMLEAKEKELIPETNITEERAKEISKLPRVEAKTEVRRLAEKIIYEIELPGVNRLEDIIIRKLENGIEIKAYSLKKAYYKIIPADYLITNYSLKKGKLILELLDEE